MRVLRHEPYLLPAFLDGSLRPMGTDRPAGLHLGAIVHRMRVEAGEKVDDLPGEQPGLRAQIGFLWERAIEWAWKEYNGVVRPVRHEVHLESDGIHMSPDGLNDADECVEEYKFTWRSRRKADEAFEIEFWPWHIQTMGYARAAGWTKTRYIVFWAGGSYFKGDRPWIGPWVTEVEWVAKELDDNWATILRYKAVIEKEEATA